MCVRWSGRSGWQERVCSSYLPLTVIIIPADILPLPPHSPHPSIPRGLPELLGELKCVDCFPSVPLPASIPRSLHCRSNVFTILGDGERKRECVCGTCGICIPAPKRNKKRCVCVYECAHARTLAGDWKECCVAIFWEEMAK